jgi:hypothetical protein
VDFPLRSDSEESVDDDILLAELLETSTPATFFGKGDSQASGSAHFELSPCEFNKLSFGAAHNDFDFVAAFVGNSCGYEAIATVVSFSAENGYSSGVRHELSESIEDRHSGSLDQDWRGNTVLARGAMFQYPRPFGVSDPHEV